VQNVLKDFFAIETKTAQMYKKNLSLALLESTFHLSTLPQDSTLEGTGMTPRVVQIGLLLDDCFDKLSAFDDVKGYVSLLTFEEAKTLVDVILPKMFDSVRHLLHSLDGNRDG
jgi:N-terminal acetyltransferase B complex non-catalytic subunit